MFVSDRRWPQLAGQHGRCAIDVHTKRRTSADIGVRTRWGLDRMTKSLSLAFLSICRSQSARFNFPTIQGADSFVVSPPMRPSWQAHQFSWTPSIANSHRPTQLDCWLAISYKSHYSAVSASIGIQNVAIPVLVSWSVFSFLVTDTHTHTGQIALTGSLECMVENC